MTVYILDASALIRYLDDAPGAERVEAIITECLAGRAQSLISAIQWGEVAVSVHKRFGASRVSKIMDRLAAAEIEVVPATREQALDAAGLIFSQGISYADGFSVDLAMKSSEHVLVTADYGLKGANNLARIEFLPAK
jgi:predicted nucleic acid-binding protein